MPVAKDLLGLTGLGDEPGDHISALSPASRGDLMLPFQDA
jgi:hypothetical protein